MGLNIFISLAISGLMNALFASKIPYKFTIVAVISAATLGFYALYVELNGLATDSLFGGSVSKSGHSLSGLFQLGLIAGIFDSTLFIVSM